MYVTPIALFVYGRPEHTAQTLHALMQNKRAEETQLVVFCDGARSQQDQDKVQRTCDCVKNILSGDTPFAAVDIIERSENWGLSKSIISGVDALMNRAGRAIVVEDDIVTSPYFLPYHLDALDHYQNQTNVFSISGWSPPPNVHTIPDDYPHQVYFNPRNSAWGWSMWQDRWEKMDFDVSDYEDLKNSLSLQLSFNELGDDVSQMLCHQQEFGLDTWDIQTSYSHFRHHAVALFPCKSLVNNIGLDNSGENCGNASHLTVDLTQAEEITHFPEQIYLDERIRQSYRASFARPYPGLFGGAAETYWDTQRSADDNTNLFIAETYLKTGDLKAAKATLDAHLQSVPGDPAANTLMGYLALQLDKSDIAKDCFRFALMTYGDYAPALNGMRQIT